MNIQPMQNRVIVTRDEEKKMTAGGLYIPDGAKEKPQQGTVVAVGPGARDEQGRIHPVELRAGDVVLFGKYAGTDVTLDGQELLIVREDDILGRVVE